MKNITLLIVMVVLLTACDRCPNIVNDIPTPPVADVKTTEPAWPMPEGAAAIQLSKTDVSKEGELIEGSITLNGLTLLLDTMLDKGFKEAIPLVIIVKAGDGDVVRFRDGLASLEHTVNIGSISKDGKYSFPVELIGYKSGRASLRLSWKWPVATEGCCSIALLTILAGCNNNAACICSTMSAMAAPCSWCCSIHPWMFRYYRRFYKCTGPSTY